MTFRLSPSYRYFGLSGQIALQQGTTDTAMNLEAVQNKLTVVPYFWNPNTLAFEVGRQPSTGGGAGSSAVDATLTSDGSTRLVGQVTVANPTTSVTPIPTTPGSSNDYLWVRTVGSAAGSTEVDANLTSAGSTKLVGQVTVANPSTSVTLTNPTTLVDQGGPAGSSASAWWVRTVSTQTGGAGSTTVDANLTSEGSTKLVGRVDVNGTVSVTGTTAVSVSGTVSVTGTTSVSVANPTTSVTVTSGVVLGAGSSANTLGAVAQAAGSSANFWVVDSFAFSSAQTSRSSVSTTVDTQIVAANANRRALVIANRSTAQTVGVGYSTGAVTTGLANVDLFIGPSAHISFGFQGTLPLYLGPLRGINLTSTAVGGSVAVTQFLNT